MSAYEDIDNLDHEPDIAIALGNMVVAWARAESALINVFAAVSGMHIDMATAAYFRIPSFEARIKILQAMIPEWEADGSKRDAMLEVITKLSKLAAARNKWIHGVWSATRDLSETVVFNFRTSSNEVGRRLVIRVNDIDTHVNAVRGRTHDMRIITPLVRVVRVV